MNPSESLFKSIRRSPHTADLSEKLGEVALDRLLSSEVLREVPVFGSVLSLLGAGNEIQAYFLSKKILRFLSELESTTEDERSKFLEKHEGEMTKEDNIGETLLMLVEKADNLIIAALLGKALCLFIKGKIDGNLFEVYSYIIKEINPYLIRQIKKFYGLGSISMIDAHAAIQLANYGVVDVVTLSTLSGPRSKTMGRSFLRTPFGRAFYENLLQDTE